MLLILYVAVFLWFDRLSFAVARDERFYWPTIEQFAEQFPPPVSLLRNYDEPSTPLFFVFYGAVEHFTHRGIQLARILNLGCSWVVVCIILRGFRANPGSVLACAGLLIYPYFLGTSVYLYPDILAALWVIAGVGAARCGRDWPAAVLFALGIATRQYMVAFPAAYVILGALDAYHARRWERGIIPYALSCLTLGGWFLFFGGLAPAAGRAAHLSMDPGGIHLDHALYFLSCIGAYYVVVEAALFRMLHFRATSIAAISAMIVILLCCISPPQGNSIGVETMGYLDKFLHYCLPPALCVIALTVLATLAAFRFAQSGLAGWWLFMSAAVLLRSHTAWDKYALPLLAALWFLKSREPQTRSPTEFGPRLT
ncbi:MAG TPA: hypothetical protein VMV81_12930 [Phycisphaerae bacterium]|nr:hypothetical protein [Phycisphaerae bacterium]